MNNVEPSSPLVQAPIQDKGFTLGALLRELVEIILLAAVMFFGIRSVVQNYYIESISMLPTLHEGQFLLINRFAYCPGLHVDVPTLNLELDRQVCVSQPQRGDVIVFHFPGNPSVRYIKRVIGLPGDSVEVRKGQIYINGQPYEAHFGENPGNYSTSGATVVGPDEYYVLGDNRDNSSDSHVWGTVPAHFIVGKAWLRYWPLPEVGFIGQGSQ